MLIVNGKVLEAGSSESILLNRAFKFGDGLFEDMRVYKGKVLFADLHIQRLLEGMESLKFSFDKSAWSSALKASFDKSLKLNQIQANGRLRIHVYRSGVGAFAPLTHEPAYLLEGYSLKDDYFQSSFQTSLTDYEEVTLFPGIISKYYASNSLPITLAAIHAKAQGYEEGILYGPKGPAMTSTGNLFIVKQKKLYTPGVEAACVDGIMRSQIISLCKGLKIPVVEKNLKQKDLERADELFVCNVLRGIVPVKQYNQLLTRAESYVLTPFLRQCLLQYIDDLFA